MAALCIGPICIPLNLLLPFLIGLLHRYGCFKWFKKEWVTLQFWKRWWEGYVPATRPSLILDIRLLSTPTTGCWDRESNPESECRDETNVHKSSLTSKSDTRASSGTKKTGSTTASMPQMTDLFRQSGTPPGPDNRKTI
jgi:hypothetical protein